MFGDKRRRAMSKAKQTFSLRQVAPQWIVIVVFSLIMGFMYIRHLVTGETPSSVAVSVEALQFDVFWYGVIITGGIVLGSSVVAMLAGERGKAVFEDVVPAGLRRQPLNKLNLPDDLQTILRKNKIQTTGQLLLRWGYDPNDIGLNRAGQRKLKTILSEHPKIEEEWLEDAPWRIWNPNHVWNGVAWCLILAVVGARLYHVLTPSPSMAALGIHSPLDYFRQPLQLINLRNGGLGIYGGIVGGLAGLLIYTRRARIPTLAWADLSGVGLALGQFVGRWGNFFNQELYGQPTDVPWAVTIDPTHRLPEYADFSQFHPAFLYESLWNLLSFLVLLTLVRRYQPKLKTGDLMALYLIFYGIGRILLELVRLDSRTVVIGTLDLGMPIATLVSLLTAIAVLIWRVYTHRRVATFQ